MLLMLAFVALGIDGAKLMATRTQLQNAADAGALAGASVFDASTGTIIPAEAELKAKEVALMNKAFKGGPEPVDDVTVNVTNGNRDCEVTAYRSGTIVTHLAQVVGLKRLSTSATATARISKPDSVCEVLVPFGAVPPAPGGFLTGCDHLYPLKLDTQDASAGNYQLVDFPECNEGPCAGMNPTGGNTLRCYITNGYPCCVGIGATLELTTEPGGKTGPVGQGLDARFDADYVDDEGICHSEYLARGGTGQRVINVPLIETFVGANGRKQVKVIGFSAFFLRDKPKNVLKGVDAEFLYDVVPGKGDTGTGTVYSIKLIK
jgi:hypothetical protein